MAPSALSHKHQTATDSSLTMVGPCSAWYESVPEICPET
jgi:hypothetical protein